MEKVKQVQQVGTPTKALLGVSPKFGSGSLVAACTMQQYAK